MWCIHFSIPRGIGACLSRRRFCFSTRSSFSSCRHTTHTTLALAHNQPTSTSGPISPTPTSSNLVVGIVLHDTVGTARVPGWFGWGCCHAHAHAHTHEHSALVVRQVPPWVKMNRSKRSRSVCANKAWRHYLPSSGTSSLAASISIVCPQYAHGLSTGVDAHSIDCSRVRVWCWLRSRVRVVKVLIKGDRNTGKTCLWNMLQRRRFVEEYIPTPEIQIANIDWSFKCTLLARSLADRSRVMLNLLLNLLARSPV